MVHELQHEFTNRKISPWGGIKLVQQVYERCGLKENLAQCPLPMPGSNRGYSPIDLVEGFMVSVMLGAKRLAHSGMLRTDEVVRDIFDWEKGMASQSTFSRFFRKFSIDLNDEVFPALQKRWFDQITTQGLTLDIDSTVITRYGDQEDAEVGYNPSKRGRKSHHPILAFCDELKMVVNAWMRSGNSASSTQAVDFLKETLTIVPAERIGLVRFDAGFFSDGIMTFLEGQSRPVNYIIRAKLTARLREHVRYESGWTPVMEEGPEQSYIRVPYQATGWGEARHVVVVRTPRHAPKENLLFDDIAEFERYEYKFFVTNMDLSGVQIHRLYNQRGDCENRIRELKYDYGIEGFALMDFAAMEAAFRFTMAAYNLMALFKLELLKNQPRKMLSTLRFQCIAIGSYVVKSGRKKILKLSAEGRRREFLEYFFQNVEVIKPPFVFSNA